MIPTSTDEQKEKITQIFKALIRRGDIVKQVEFFSPLEINASLSSIILNKNHKGKFPKGKLPLLFKEWNVNHEWFFFNKGEMFSEKENVTQYNKLITPIIRTMQTEENLREINRHVIAIPILEKRAQAGYAMGHADLEYLENIPKIYVSKEFGNQSDFVAFEVVGDSMDDNFKHSICDRDVVLAAILEQDHWKNKLHIKTNLFVVVYNEGCVIKQITSHDTETGDITCHSYNEMYPDFTINLEDDYQLLYVVKVVDRAIKI